MGAKIQAFDIFQTPLSSHYPLPLKLPAAILSSVLKFCVKILFCKHYFQSAQQLNEKREGSVAGSIRYLGSRSGSRRPKNNADPAPDTDPNTEDFESLNIETDPDPAFHVINKIFI
jgi:hypothetical protein